MRKPRSITRANKKKGFSIEQPLSPYGPGGYADPTSYLALRNIERETERWLARNDCARKMATRHSSQEKGKGTRRLSTETLNRTKMTKDIGNNAIDSRHGQRTVLFVATERSVLWSKQL
jgi:hypothetical protein